MPIPRKPFYFLLVGAAALTAILVALMIVLDPGHPPAPPAPIKSPAVFSAAATAPLPTPVAPLASVAPTKPDLGPISALAPKSTGRVLVHTVTVQEAEADYLHAASNDDREAAARQLASMDTAESLQLLTQLFAKARSYPEKVAIIGALTDAQSDDTLDAKLALLRDALATGQPRPVRSAALDAAAQLDDPRAVAMLQQAARHDPDSQLRELAKAALPEPPAK